MLSPPRRPKRTARLLRAEKGLARASRARRRRSRRCVRAAGDEGLSVGIAHHPPWGCGTRPQPGFSRTPAVWKEGAGAGVQAGGAQGRPVAAGSARLALSTERHGWKVRAWVVGLSAPTPALGLLQTLSGSPREAGRGGCDVKTSLIHDVFLADPSCPAVWVL